jgi:hypothetical protein
MINTKLDITDASFIYQYPFEKFCTLTYNGIRNIESVNKDLTAWSSKLCIQESIRFAYIGIIFNSDSCTHVHLLALGTNKAGKSLLSIPNGKYSSDWKHGIADIQPIDAINLNP